jgi:dsRNA-specific ribonuclease
MKTKLILTRKVLEGKKQWVVGFVRDGKIIAHGYGRRKELARQMLAQNLEASYHEEEISKEKTTQQV